MLNLNDDITWTFQMDEYVDQQLAPATQQAAVTIAGTGYAMGETSALGMTSWKRFARPEGGIVGVFNRLYILGALTESTHKVTQQIVAIMGAIYGWMLMVTAVRSIIKHWRGILTAIAAVETAAFAIAQQWHAIAMAAVGAAAVTVGLKIGEGDWNFPGFDLDNHHERRKAMENAQEEYRNGQLARGDMFARQGIDGNAKMAYQAAGLTDEEAWERLKWQYRMAHPGGI